MLTTRRSFLKHTGLLAMALALRPAAASPLIPGLVSVPDLSESNVIRFTACIRPHRDQKIRLEWEELGEKLVFHHYGHGGAGITLSWGSADAAVAQIRARVKPDGEIAVIGAGIIGLSTALILAEQGYAVRIYSKDFWPNHTSSKAGGQWSPAGVSGDIGDMLRVSHRRFQALLGPKYGVYRRPNYTQGKNPSTAKIPAELIAPLTDFERLPFPGVAPPGQMFETFLIEPPTYLPQLTRDLLDRGVQFTSASFTSVAELAGLPQSVIVNCMGMGSKPIFPDPLLTPIRGQLVHIRPDLACHWLLLHKEGYIFPRHDCIVVGGTYEHGESDPTPNPQTCLEILMKNRRFLGQA